MIAIAGFIIVPIGSIRRSACEDAAQDCVWCTQNQAIAICGECVGQAVTTIRDRYKSFIRLGRWMGEKAAGFPATRISGRRRISEQICEYFRLSAVFRMGLCLKTGNRRGKLCKVGVSAML
jgi:hypothetical protein